MLIYRCGDSWCRTRHYHVRVGLRARMIRAHLRFVSLSSLIRCQADLKSASYLNMSSEPEGQPLRLNKGVFRLVSAAEAGCSCVVLVLGLRWCCRPVRSQNLSFGSINGTVTDASGRRASGRDCHRLEPRTPPGDGEAVSSDYHKPENRGPLR